MNKRTIFMCVLISGSLVVVSPRVAIGMQGHEDGAQSNSSASITLATDAKLEAPSTEARSEKGMRSADKVPFTNSQKIEADKITSFFVRANDSKRILLSMLVAYRAELTEAVRQIFGQKVTPLVFSVSTLPNRSVNFDPALLRFEQRGRVWQPVVNNNSADILPLDENAKFGGTLIDGEVHQGIVMLPAWINPKEPITVRYGDFHYLARFAELPTNTVNDK
ncbi:MAG: hypothetical protein ONA90_04080 [candidate division KSB1 bacterium]|nr:hypothetical protein [candidate division KSB1 bacterium]